MKKYIKGEHNILITVLGRNPHHALKAARYD